MIEELELRLVEALVSGHCSVEGLDSFCSAAIGLGIGDAGTLAEIFDIDVTLVHSL
jgi:hypothetical protein